MADSRHVKVLVALSSFYVLVSKISFEQASEFYQTCTDISIKQSQKLIRFW